MVNIIPPDYVDDVPVVEPNQHDDVPVVLEPILVDEDEDLEEDKFEEEEDPQEEEDDMEIDIKEDENEPESTYPYEEVDPLNPPPPASESDLRMRSRTVMTAHALVEKKGKTKDEYYGKLILDLGNEVRSSVEQRTAAMEKLVEKLVEKLGNAEDKVEYKRLRKELEEARVSNTFLRFVFEERPNEAINVSIEDEKSPSSESRGSPHDS
ncbi:hypothetical protein Tco_0232821 [Tanacetum coccineum]